MRLQHHLVLRGIAVWLAPPIILFALYVQFHGDFGPGGGFQAGVIFAMSFILYGLVFGLLATRRMLSPHTLRRGMALGVLLYIGVGFAGLFTGGAFLDYTHLAAEPAAGQHLGIFLIELGVGITVAAVMCVIFHAFSARPPQIRDEEW